MNNALPAVVLVALGLLGASCSTTEPRPTARDPMGNYATTSTFNATQRTEFATAMREGLADYDRRRAELETRASKLGQSSIEQYHKAMPGLTERRNRLVNELARLDAALDKDWPARRSDTQSAYDDLRGGLDQAYKEVLH